MLRILETRQTTPTYEERITQDENRFYRHEIRILPVNDWEPDDGWRCTFVSSVPLTLDTMKEAHARATHGR